MAEPGTDDQPFIAHLQELRRRLLLMLAAWLLASAFCYGWASELFAWLSAPLRQALPAAGGIVFIQATEPFFSYLKVALLAGALLALPVLLWQLWAFVAPALYVHEKRLAVPFVLSGCLCFGGGAWFGFQLVFPAIFSFLLALGTEGGLAQPMLSMAGYLSLASHLLLAFGLVFEMPVVSFFLSRCGLISGELLARQRRYAIVVAFVFGALLTPPDVFSQIALALPFILLYELSILVARLFGRTPQSD